MKELFLSLLLSCQELNIVDYQDIDFPILVLERSCFLVRDRLDKFAGKFLAGSVFDGLLGLVRYDLIANSLHQMSLP